MTKKRHQNWERSARQNENSHNRVGLYPNKPAWNCIRVTKLNCSDLTAAGSLRLWTQSSILQPLLSENEPSSAPPKHWVWSWSWCRREMEARLQPLMTAVSEGDETDRHWSGRGTWKNVHTHRFHLLELQVKFNKKVAHYCAEER